MAASRPAAVFRVLVPKQPREECEVREKTVFFSNAPGQKIKSLLPDLKKERKKHTRRVLYQAIN